MVRHNLDAEAVFHLPLALERPYTLVDVGCHEGVHVQFELLDAEVAHERGNFAFQRVGEEQAGTYVPRASARGAALFDFHVHGRTDALAGDLHQAELGKRQNVVARAVALHVLDHALIEFLPVFRQIHVDKVYHDDAAHIAQAELPRQFVGRAEIYVKRVGLLSVGRLGAVAAVDVHHVQGFGVLDNHVRPVLIGNRSAERSLDLLGYGEIVEDRDVAVVELDDVFTFRRDERHVVAYFFEDALVVDVNVFVRRIEEVAQEGYGAARFFVDEERQFALLLACFLYACHGIIPTPHENTQFRVEFGYALAFGHGAYDNAESLGLDALHELLEACALCAALDFGGD